MTRVVHSRTDIIHKVFWQAVSLVGSLPGEVHARTCTRHWRSGLGKPQQSQEVGEEVGTGAGKLAGVLGASCHERKPSAVMVT